MNETKTSVAIKNRVLTPKELEFVDTLAASLIGKAAANEALRAHSRDLARVTQEIAKLTFARSTVVWGEARQKVGALPAPTREQLTKGT